MTDNTLILGADIGEKFLKLSCCQKDQTELTNENYQFNEDFSEESVFQKIKGMAESFSPLERKEVKIVFSSSDSTIAMIKAVERKLCEDGFLKENLRMISQENAFIHYVLNQEEAIREYTVFLFDFDGNRLHAYRMAHSKKRVPKGYKAEKTLIGTFTFSGEKKDWGRIIDEKFAAIAKQILSKEVVSAVYLTGDGFEGGWLKKSLKILCDGRRAFMGQNLFSSGCCYYGTTVIKNPSSDYIIQAPETVLYDAGVLDSANKDAFVPICSGGNAWYETKGSLDVIMERGGKLDVVFSNTLTKEKQVESVDISSLPPRPRKTGRLHVAIHYFDSKSGVITVLDKGFGEFSKATHQVFLKEFTLL